ncbi:unnamed protein product [Hermetia illucens]|uniref:Uncharacterized protein n=1 Tax=Hermetia illucens TaxID=343691 RepID=A0A7R8YY38_HERIL|nr:uncharacterized protein LOC119656998 [Hermetia illucens]CAD7090068.1 unnamed protein product [Hermetia illucens]
MDLLLLSPPKPEQTEQLRHVAAGTIADPYQLAKDLQLSDDSDSEESFSVGKPEQAVKSSFCLFKDMPLLGDSTGQPSAAVNNQQSWNEHLDSNGQRIARKGEDRENHLVDDLQLSDDSDFEDVPTKPNHVSDLLSPLNPGTERKTASTWGANEEQRIARKGENHLADDLQLSDDSDFEDVPTKPNQVSDLMSPLNPGTERKTASTWGANEEQRIARKGENHLADDLQLSDDSDFEDVPTKPNQVSDLLLPLNPGTERKTASTWGAAEEDVPKQVGSCLPNFQFNGQRIARKGEDNFRSYQLADDLQLSDDSDFEDVPTSQQLCDLLPRLNPGTEWTAASTRGSNDEDVPKQVGSCLPTLQQFNGIVPGNGSYSLLNDLELSEDSDSDSDFGAVQPEQVSSFHSNQVEHEPVLNIGDPLHAPIKRMPEEFVEVKPQSKRDPEGLPRSDSFRRSIGMSDVVVIQPSGPLALQHGQKIDIISNELVKPAVDSTVKLAPAGDSKADGKTIERNSLHRIQGEKQRSKGLSRHAVTVDSAGRNPQKVRTTPISEIYNGRQTTKPMKVAAILPSGSRPEQKSSAPSLDPLPENYTLPVARKVRTSTFTKKDIENQISRGKELLQKASDSNCEDEGNGKKILSSGLPTKKTTANMSVGPERNKQEISKEIDKSMVDSKEINQQITKGSKTDEHERRTPKGSEMEGLISRGKENKRNSANQSTKHSTSKRKGGPSNEGIIQISEAYQKKQAITNETGKSSDFINKTEANGDGTHQKLLHKMDVPKPHKRNDKAMLRRTKKSPDVVHNKNEGRKGEAHHQLLHKMDEPKPHKRNAKEMLDSRSPTDKDEKSANRDGKTDRRTKKSADVVHNKNEGRKDEAHHQLLHKMDEPKPHKEMLGSRSSTDKDEKPANRDGKTGRRTKKNLDVVHNKNEGRKDEAHKMEEPKPNKRNAKEMLGSRWSIGKDEKSEGNFTQETEPPRKKHKIANESKKPTSDSQMRISEDSTTDKHERKSSKGSHSENKDRRIEAPHPQFKEMPSPKIDGKSLKKKETANAPAINKDFIQDPGVKNLSDIDKFKILRQEYIVLMELLKKPANLVVELKSVLDQKKKSGTAKEVMALKETILVVGRELRSESFQSQKRKLKQLRDQLESLKRIIRNKNKTGTLDF